MTERISSLIPLVHFDSDVIPFPTEDTTLVEGQAVYINGNGTVAKQTAGNQFPIGFVYTPTNNKGYVGVGMTAFGSTLKGSAKGGTLTFGSFVRQDGTLDANGLPNFVAAASGEFASAIVIEGAAAGSAIYVGVLSMPRTV